MSVLFTRRAKPRGVNYVEYIKSTGTQWIDTEIKPNQDTRVVIDCQRTAATTVYPFPFGGRAGLTSGMDAALGATQVFYHFGGNYQFVDFAGAGDRMTIDANGPTATFTTATDAVTVTLAAATFSETNNLVLFSLNEGGNVYTDGSAFTGITWSCKIYQGGALVRDMWPCYDPDGVVCMYDRVSKEYLYNAGTGEFIAAGEEPDDPGIAVGTTWTFLEDGSFTVPATGNYQLELHGGGGGGAGSMSDYTGVETYLCASGGGSGEVMAVPLTEGDTVGITIGAGGAGAGVRYQGTASNAGDGGATSFGAYSVAGGGGGRAHRMQDSATPGAAAGSLATEGSVSMQFNVAGGGQGNKNNTAQTYGDGGIGGETDAGNTGQPGAVIVTYLG